MQWVDEKQEENCFQSIQVLLPNPQSSADGAASNLVLTVLLIQGVRQSPELAQEQLSGHRVP